MPDFRDSFTAREVCEGMLGQINVNWALTEKQLVSASLEVFVMKWLGLISLEKPERKDISNMIVRQLGEQGSSTQVD